MFEHGTEPVRTVRVVAGSARRSPRDGRNRRQTTSVLLGWGDGTFAGSVPYSGGGSVVIAELTGDGNKDIASFTGTQVTILPGKGDGTFAK